MLVGDSSGVVRIWNLLADKESAQLKKGTSSAVTALFVSPDGTHCVVGEADGTVSDWFNPAGRM